MILNHLTNDELLRMLDDRIAKSPILRELARRLRSAMDTRQINEISEQRQPHLCPVCEADISEKP